ncbi:MAG: ATP-binding protein [Bacteroidota bacterium]
MNSLFVGRKAEILTLEDAFVSPEAEMISIIGRRRVGKTYLVQQVYHKYIDFEISGIQNAEGTEQLRNFSTRLREFFPQKLISHAPKDWLDAFIQLVECLQQKRVKRKLVVFFDEVPWLATHKSGFLKGLSYFWNSWAVKQKIVVVLCGSAASWMIQKVLRNRGGLHNRVTKRIRLQAFNLAETEAYLNRRNVKYNRYQLLQLYMAIGGIPHYLKEVERGQSVVQNINRICFNRDGLLHDEFLSLYPALFDHADYHIAIIRALASKYMGLTRNGIIAAAKLPDGGRISKVLEELIESGFIQYYPAYGKQLKDKLYRLTDEYSLFYLRFIEKNRHDSKDAWQALSQTAKYKTWTGYAFENICWKHTEQIKKALGIRGVYSITSSFYKVGRGDEPGAQIDLLIDRNDQIINLIEAKFYNTAFTLNKDYANRLREKLRIFQETTKTKKQLFLTLITTFGLKANKHSLDLIQSDLEMDILFDE